MLKKLFREYIKSQLFINNRYSTIQYNNYFETFSNRKKITLKEFFPKNIKGI